MGFSISFIFTGALGINGAPGQMPAGHGTQMLLGSLAAQSPLPPPPSSPTSSSGCPEHPSACACAVGPVPCPSFPAWPRTGLGLPAGFVLATPSLSPWSSPSPLWGCWCCQTRGFPCCPGPAPAPCGASRESPENPPGRCQEEAGEWGHESVGEAGLGGRAAASSPSWGPRPPSSRILGASGRRPTGAPRSRTGLGKLGLPGWAARHAGPWLLAPRAIALP